MAEHSPPQKKILETLRRTYGNANVKAYARSKVNGRMRVELTAQAGKWTWIYAEDGELVLKYMSNPLFDMPPTPPKPTNAIHN